MKVSDLKENPKNPRKITEKRLNQLSKAVQEFGDLSGIVFNKKTNHLVSGHQRMKLFEKDTEVIIDAVHKKPTATGTIAEGFVILRGERFPYREVSWDETREKQLPLQLTSPLVIGILLFSGTGLLILMIWAWILI